MNPDYPSRMARLTARKIENENWSYRKAMMEYIGLDCGRCDII